MGSSRTPMSRWRSPVRRAHRGARGPRLLLRRSSAWQCWVRSGSVPTTYPGHSRAHPDHDCLIRGSLAARLDHPGARDESLGVTCCRNGARRRGLIGRIGVLDPGCDRAPPLAGALCARRSVQWATGFRSWTQIRISLNSAITRGADVEPDHTPRINHIRDSLAAGRWRWWAGVRTKSHHLSYGPCDEPLGGSLSPTARPYRCVSPGQRARRGSNIVPSPPLDSVVEMATL